LKAALTNNLKLETDLGATESSEKNADMEKARNESELQAVCIKMLQRQNNNRRKTKSLHCPQLDHHDADGLAGHKAWRTTQTIMRRYKRLLISIF
jgi:hypothetical protein